MIARDVAMASWMVAKDVGMVLRMVVKALLWCCVWLLSIALRLQKLITGTVTQPAAQHPHTRYLFTIITVTDIHFYTCCEADLHHSPLCRITRVH